MDVNANKTVLVVSHNGKSVERPLGNEVGEGPLKISVEPDTRYLLRNSNDAGPENLTVNRLGEDLQVTLEGESQPSLILASYFSTESESAGLFGAAEDGQLHPYVRTDADGEIFTLAEGQLTPAVLGSDAADVGDLHPTTATAAAPAIASADEGNGIFTPLLILGGLAGVGIASSHGSGSDSSAALPVHAPSTASVKPEADGGAHAVVVNVKSVPDAGVATIVGVEDDTGNAKRLIASGEATDDSRPVLEGTASPGHTAVITVDDAAGSHELGRAEVSADGTWTLHVDAPLKAGLNEFHVYMIDLSGVRSDNVGAAQGYAVWVDPAGTGSQTATSADVSHSHASAIEPSGLLFDTGNHEIDLSRLDLPTKPVVPTSAIDGAAPSLSIETVASQTGHGHIAPTTDVASLLIDDKSHHTIL
ncbi:Ig-like domain-containing protein [Variovorax sp. GT1P44]|uniref:Ig-like domain-containing protein n=1 Tax=Variovorax sp. GT1P44 TaxID=3443742 RepID=UPI003F45BFBB